VIARRISVLTGDPGGGTSSLAILYAGDAPEQPSGVTQVNFQLPPTVAANWFPLQIQAGSATVQFLIQVIDLILRDLPRSAKGLPITREVVSAVRQSP
jgi:hypothetical protein